MIIVEGMDNSGKSTLAKTIAFAVGLPIKESEGPPRDQLSFTQRVERYFDLEPHVIVRHPIISEDIYGASRDASFVLDKHREHFYNERHLFIYCDPKQRGMFGHVLMDHDTPEHMELVGKDYDLLLRRYRNWALHNAHLIYRIGDTHLYDILEAARRHAHP